MSYPIVNTNTGKTLERLAPMGKLSADAHRWIGRCKKCGAKHKLEGHVMQGFAGSHAYDVVQATSGGIYMTADSGSNLYKVAVPCGDHWCTLQRVHEGTKASKHECGARCTNATGPSCDCRCKGKNHGSNC